MDTLTPNDILGAVSRRLREPSVETGQRRIGFLNDAIRHIVNLSSWSWKIKQYDINTVANQQEYDLPDDCFKVREAYSGKKELVPIDYDQRENVLASNYTYFYLTLNKTKIGFIPVPSKDGDTLTIFYYQAHQDIASPTDNFNIAIPKYMLEPIVLYMKYLVHDSKRERYDARNAIFDFVETIKEAIDKDATRRAKDNPKRFSHPWRYIGFTRSYTRG